MSVVIEQGSTAYKLHPYSNFDASREDGGSE